MISDVKVIFFRHEHKVYPAYIVVCPDCGRRNFLFYSFRVFKCEYCGSFHFADPRVVELTRRVEVKFGSFDDITSYLTVKNKVLSRL